MITTALIQKAQSPTLLLVAVFVAAVFVWQRRRASPQKTFDTFPEVELDRENVQDSIMKAMHKHPDTPFLLPMEQKWVMLPHKLVNEVKKLPVEESSFMATIYNRMQGFYTGIGRSDHPEGVGAIRHDLTKNMSNILNALQDESVFAFEKEIGDCCTPKQLKVYETMTKLVARLSARTFVGLPLCRDDEWIHATSNLTTNIMATIKKITDLSPWLRPFAVLFLPEFRKLISLNFFFGRKLKPQVTAIVNAYQASRKAKDAQLKPDTEQIDHQDAGDDNHNLIHWVIRNFKNPEKVTAGEIGRVEIGVAFAAIHTTSLTLSQIVFDIASHVEYVADLRAEIEAVIMEEDYPDRKLRKTSIPKLKKLDSFMKESQRMNPIGMVNMPRIVLAKNGITLSTGHHLPFGTFLGFPGAFFTTSTFKSDTIMTDENQRPFSEFYPWRYSDIRRTPGHETRHQFISADDDDISFGGGRHTCPGRFFASHEIKVILVELLRNYDISLGPEGQGSGQDGYQRPALQEHDTFCSLDMGAKIWIRRRQI